VLIGPGGAGVEHGLRSRLTVPAYVVVTVSVDEYAYPPPSVPDVSVSATETELILSDIEMESHWLVTSLIMEE
jgi:hypothetical protein